MIGPVGIPNMPITAATLTADLVEAPSDRWIRLLAHWLGNGEVSSEATPLTGRPVIDALVAAATAQLARSQGVAVPLWTPHPSRFLTAFWQPAGPQFYAWSPAHAADEFLLRGIIVEQESLVAV